MTKRKKKELSFNYSQPLGLKSAWIWRNTQLWYFGHFPIIVLHLQHRISCPTSAFIDKVPFVFWWNPWL